MLPIKRISLADIVDYMDTYLTREERIRFGLSYDTEGFLEMSPRYVINYIIEEYDKLLTSNVNVFSILPLRLTESSKERMAECIFLYFENMHGLVLQRAWKTKNLIRIASFDESRMNVYYWEQTSSCTPYASPELRHK